MGLGIFDNSKQNTDQNEDNWLIIESLTKKCPHKLAIKLS